MLVGIGFLTVVTAVITSSFVSRSRLQPAIPADDPPTNEQLRQIDKRLERIEAALNRSA